MKFELPKLSDDARGELPGADTKMSTQRGTLAHWVISSLSVGLAFFIFLFWQGSRDRVNKCELKLEKYENILIPELNSIGEQAKNIDSRIDTVVKKIENNDSLTIKNSNRNESE